MYKMICCFSGAILLVALTANTSLAKGGPHGGGPPGHAASAGGTPPGWSHGRKVGWSNGQPRGFTHGKKKGWRGGLTPPGWRY
jgi:hypothetical protein